MDKVRKFEIGDIVKGINPYQEICGKHMKVVGFGVENIELIFMTELTTVPIKTYPNNIELVARVSRCSNNNNVWGWCNTSDLTEGTLKAAEQSVNQFNKTIKEYIMATEKLTIEVDVKQLGLIGKTKKEKTPKIVCKVDGELMEFKNEEALKSFTWTSRCNEVIRYDLTGKVSVPFELTTTLVK